MAKNKNSVVKKNKIKRDSISDNSKQLVNGLLTGVSALFIASGIALILGSMAMGVYAIILAVLSFFTSYGLFSRKKWGRILAIILLLLFLFNKVRNVTIGISELSLVWVLMFAIVLIMILYLLFNKNVKEAFK